MKHYNYYNELEYRSVGYGKALWNVGAKRALSGPIHLVTKNQSNRWASSGLPIHRILRIWPAMTFSCSENGR